MIPKEKAEEIFNKMLKYTFCPEYADEKDLGLEQGTFTKEGEWERFCAKQLALIAVDEIMEECFACKEIYWREVKFQIKKL
jgi:hypothetical protein